MTQVMGWYRDETPPFENGKKKHEFPDAIALSQIIGFAQKDNSLVSFITSDKGIGRACENQTQISRYSTLPKFIDVILSDNSFAQQYKDELLGQGEQLVSSIKEFDDWFNLELEFSDDVSSIDARVRFDLSDVTVIGVGESECTFLASYDVTFTYGQSRDNSEHNTSDANNDNSMFKHSKRRETGHRLHIDYIWISANHNTCQIP